ncbi:DUF4365 domain-containing protein [Streptomyces virginiae]|uniref:DUF4365 domain-containing protein n=1 Tax=Streptomyces virginiae TaxID=1961 RepID=UPI003246247F
MAGVPRSRRTGRAAVNCLRTLLERHDHIVQEIDGQNDFGEDLYVTFTDDGQTTGDVIKVQVKGGKSWRRSYGYGVPVAQHAETWADGNVPVICVVHEPDGDGLYWGNATAQLLQARREQTTLKTIRVSSEAQLNDRSLSGFVSQVRRYVGRYRGNRALLTELGEMAGVDFDPADLVLHFINIHGEDLIFWQRRGEDFATLLHSDLDWDPQRITPNMLRLFGGLTANYKLDDLPEWMRAFANVPTVGDIILDEDEAAWLAACFGASRWARNAEEN